MSKYVVTVYNEDGNAGSIVYQEKGGPIDNRPAIFKSRKGAEDFAEYMGGKFPDSVYRVLKANVFP